MMSTNEDDSSTNARLRPRKASVPLPPLRAKLPRKSDNEQPDKPKTTSKKKDDKNIHTATTSSSSSTLKVLCLFCAKKFNSKKSSFKHVSRTHFGPKLEITVNCQFCKQTEFDADSLIQHLINTHSDQYFLCLLCRIRFPTKEELYDHKNSCEKHKSLVAKPYRNRLRKKNKGPGGKRRKHSVNWTDDDNKFLKSPDSNSVVISCELKPPERQDAADIEDSITTNLILPTKKHLVNTSGIQKNAVIVLDDIQWNKRVASNFSFHNTDTDQILSRLGVVHRSPRTNDQSKRDLLKQFEEALKFEKCFDTSFYSRVASNVQENLTKYLEGSFHKFPENENMIKTRKAKNNVVINTAEGFPILLASQQYSRNSFDSYLPRGVAPKHKWKWDNIEADKNIVNTDEIKRDSHVNNCIITRVSSLDIWTQLIMRQKFEAKFNYAVYSEKKAEKQSIINNELKEILESRELPKPSQSMIRYKSRETSGDSLEPPNWLGLAPAKGTYEMKPAVLSGEWARPRRYVCCACGDHTNDPKALTTHIATQHPYAQVSHFEILDEIFGNGEILKHLYIPPPQAVNRTRPLRGIKECTKCKKIISLEELHQHMLECAGDTPVIKRKGRSRPFGVRKKRQRMTETPVNSPSPSITEKTVRKDDRSKNIRRKTMMRPRPRNRTEVGDADTIRKMIADLPAKRHHRIITNPSLNNARTRRLREMTRNERNQIIAKQRRNNDRMVKIKMRSNNLKQNSNTANGSQSKGSTNERTLVPSSSQANAIRRSKRAREILKRRIVLRQTRSTLSIKNQEASKLVSTSKYTTSAVQTDEVSVQFTSDKINIKDSDANPRMHAAPDRSNNRDGKKPDKGSNQNGSHPNNTQQQNIPLKHSIERLTANHETHDKSVQFQPHFLVQQECYENVDKCYGPVERQTLFENECAIVKLHKPPLNEKNISDFACQKHKLNKPRKGLNDCIAMLKNKLEPLPPKVTMGQHSVQCDLPDLPPYMEDNCVIENHSSHMEYYSVSTLPQHIPPAHANTNVTSIMSTPLDLSGKSGSMYDNFIDDSYVTLDLSNKKSISSDIDINNADEVVNLCIKETCTKPVFAEGVTLDLSTKTKALNLEENQRTLERYSYGNSQAVCVEAKAVQNNTGLNAPIQTDSSPSSGFNQLMQSDPTIRVDLRDNLIPHKNNLTTLITSINVNEISTTTDMSSNANVHRRMLGIPNTETLSIAKPNCAELKSPKPSSDLQKPCLEKSIVQSEPISENNGVCESILKTKELESLAPNNVRQDLDTAKKIALLPKEIVEILGTMPCDHRNQLLNVLPQYMVCNPTVKQLKLVVDLNSDALGLGPVPSHKSEIATQTSVNSIEQACPPEFVNIDTEKYLIDPVTGAITERKAVEVVPEKTKVSGIVQNTTTSKSSDVLHNKNNISHDETFIAPIIVKPIAQKEVNVKTASLRAVRIKAVERRKSEQSSVKCPESLQNALNTMTALQKEKFLAIQQSDISSTQHNYNNGATEVPKLITNDSRILPSVNNSCVQKDATGNKGEVTEKTTISDENSTLEHIPITETCELPKSIEEDVVSTKENVIECNKNVSVTKTSQNIMNLKNEMSEGTKSVSLTELHAEKKSGNIDDDDSDDDVLLAVILQKKNEQQNESEAKVSKNKFKSSKRTTKRAAESVEQINTQEVKMNITQKDKNIVTENNETKMNKRPKRRVNQVKLPEKKASELSVEQQMTPVVSENNKNLALVTVSQNMDQFKKDKVNSLLEKESVNLPATKMFDKAETIDNNTIAKDVEPCTQDVENMLTTESKILTKEYATIIKEVDSGNKINVPLTSEDLNSNSNSNTTNVHDEDPLTEAEMSLIQDNKPLRRSRRGKSSYVASVKPVIKVIPDEIKAPLTKKQLIFSKLLLDEEKSAQALMKLEETIECDTLVSIKSQIEEKCITENNDLSKLQKRKTQHETLLSTKKIKMPNAPIHETSSTLHEEILLQNTTETIASDMKESIFTPTPVNCADNEPKAIIEGDNLLSPKNKKDTFDKVVRSLDEENQIDVENETETLLEPKTVKEVSQIYTQQEKCTYVVDEVETTIMHNKHSESVVASVKELEIENNKMQIRETNLLNSSNTADESDKATKSKTSSSKYTYDPYDIDMDESLFEKTDRKPILTKKKRKLPKKYKSTKIGPAVKKSHVNFDPSDSDDSSKSDVPLQKYVNENLNKKKVSTNIVKTGTTPQQSVIKDDQKSDKKKNQLLRGQKDKTPLQINTENPEVVIDRNEEVKPKALDSNSKEPFKEVVAIAGTSKMQNGAMVDTRSIEKSNKKPPVKNDDDAEALRSEQFMESFGFFSERKPRKSNLLASKKISETFHTIANDKDDIYRKPKDKVIKKSDRKKSVSVSETGESSQPKAKASPSPKKKRKGRKKRSTVNVNTTFCELCNKQFNRVDNYVRHQLSMSHALKIMNDKMHIPVEIPVERRNILVSFRKRLNRLKKTGERLKKRNEKLGIKLPVEPKIELLALLDMITDAKYVEIDDNEDENTIDLNRDEELFWHCCELLNKEGERITAGTSRAVVNSGEGQSGATNSTDNAKETENLESKDEEAPVDLENEADKKDDYKSDGDVDSITAKSIMESEEVRLLENDLILGLAEAAAKKAAYYNNNVTDAGDTLTTQNQLQSPIVISYQNIEIIQENTENLIQKPLEEETTSTETDSKITTQNEMPHSLQASDTNEQSVQTTVKPKKVAPKIGELPEIDLFEDKFDKIKRKSRSQAVAAKHSTPAAESCSSHKEKKKQDKKKPKKISKKVHRNTILTKGALKGFDGIKVSIPTNDINLSNIVPRLSEVPVKKKNKRSKKRESRHSESSSKYDSEDHATKSSSAHQSKVDVYEFMDNDDDLFEFRPSTLKERFQSTFKDMPSTSKADRSYQNLDTNSASCSDVDDFVYMSDDYVGSADETENSLLSCEKTIPASKRKDVVEKNAVMGKIFKNNAVRTDKKSVRLKDNVKFPKANLDQLFDSLLEGKPDSLPPDDLKGKEPVRKLHTTVLDIRLSKEDNDSLSSNFNETPVKSSTEDKNDSSFINSNKTSKAKYQHSSSQKSLVDQNTFYIQKDLQYRSDTSLKLDAIPSTSGSAMLLLDELSENETGVARHRARRKCTVGKQNVLAETWSSESEADAKVNGVESGGISRKRKGKKRMSAQHVSRKRAMNSKKVESKVGGDSEAELESNGESERASRSASQSSDHWGGDESARRAQQHGWIVGNSHKKLVTMLAHAKGRKHDDEPNFVE